MQHDVKSNAPAVGHCLLDGRAATRRGDVFHQGGGTADGADGEEVEAEDEGTGGRAGDGDLKPAAGGGAEVEHAAGAVEEPELVVELEELEGGARAVALLLGEMVELVQPLLSLGFPHRGFLALSLRRQGTKEIPKPQKPPGT